MNPESQSRLLLVDDNPTNLRVLYQALETEGYELLVAQSGEEALDIAREAGPHLVLLDINMPGIDGFETCRRMKADDDIADAVVIYLSARGDVGDKVAGFETGAVDYIEKPFQFEEVLVRVRSHLAAFHETRELKDAANASGERAHRDLSVEDVEALMQAGEGDSVEFKSTLRTNLHTGKSDKRMENACLKTLAAVSRTSPIMLGAATTILGVAPLLQDIFWVAMSVTIMAGLTFGTVFTLIVVPVVYTILFRVPATPGAGTAKKVADAKAD